MTEALAPLTLVLGGVRSGKSHYAERLIEAVGGGWYIATAQAFDDGMRDRIAQHRARRGPCWRIIEEPFDLAAGLARLACQDRPVLIDCLSLWVSNLLCDGQALEPAQERFFAALCAMPAPVVIVAQEAGLGLVPGNVLARRFCDANGQLTQRLAAKAERAVLVVAGLAMPLKG